MESFKEYVQRLASEVERSSAPTGDVVAAKRAVSGAVAALNIWLKDSSYIARLEAGHSVNYGLQHNVVVRPKGGGEFRDILFRAYIPASGFPVYLDLLAEELEVCNTVEMLQARISSLFGDPLFSGRLAQYRSSGEV